MEGGKHLGNLAISRAKSWHCALKDARTSWHQVCRWQPAKTNVKVVTKAHELLIFSKKHNGFLCFFSCFCFARGVLFKNKNWWYYRCDSICCSETCWELEESQNLPLFWRKSFIYLYISRLVRRSLNHQQYGFGVGIIESLKSCFESKGFYISSI